VAARYHLEPLVFLYQIHQESGFNPNAVSPAGAIGIAQFLPATAAGMQPPVNPWDVDSALDGAARLDLSELRSFWGRSLTIATRFGGNRNAYVWGLALAAYNAGGRAVNAALAWADRVGWSSAWTWLSAPNQVVGWSQQQTSPYVRNILGCTGGAI
jgi:soluble lytic murein transglycosylase-like protein